MIAPFNERLSAKVISHGPSGYREILPYLWELYEISRKELVPPSVANAITCVDFTFIPFQIHASIPQTLIRHLKRCPNLKTSAVEYPKNIRRRNIPCYVIHDSGNKSAPRSMPCLPKTRAKTTRKLFLQRLTVFARGDRNPANLGECSKTRLHATA